MNIESEVLNIESEVLNIESKVLNIEYKVLNIEYQVLNIEYQVLNIATNRQQYIPIFLSCNQSMYECLNCNPCGYFLVTLEP